MTAGASVPDGYAAQSASARCRAWLRRRPHLVHHLVCATAMLACLLGDRRPVSALLVIVGLVILSIPHAVRARRSRSAQELMLDLAVMTVFTLAMAPWASHASHSSSAMSMSPGSMASMSTASMTADGHGAGTIGGAVMLLALAAWAIARVSLLVSAGAPRTAEILRAVVCVACLGWMVA